MKLKLSIAYFSTVLSLFIVLFFSQIHTAKAATCLWLSSYYQGYDWNDGIGVGIDKAHWNLFANTAIPKKAGVKLQQDFLVTAIKVQP
ncbi:MAG: hypothetical protein HQL68_01170 [Magnetococcales bacterium]|nr:hypothetical protein [Magnetococcales bacterium]